MRSFPLPRRRLRGRHERGAPFHRGGSIMRTITAVTMAAVLGAPLFAQEAPKPGPEHALLKKRVGTWTTTLKSGDMENKGTFTYKMELGGLWLVGSLHSDLGAVKFSGKSLDTYDA